MIIVICILIVRSEIKTINVYEPELADNVSRDNKNENVNEEENVKACIHHNIIAVCI